MAPVLRLADEQYQQLALLLGSPTSKLDVAMGHLKKIPADALALRHIHDALRKSLERENADALARLLVAVATFRRHHEISSGTAVKSLTRGVQKFSRWSEETLKTWDKSIVPVLKLCLEIESVHVISKTADLAYDYDNLMDRISILTDLRPIFDVEHRNVVGAIICSLMRVEFRTSANHSTMTIAIDRKDIEKLEKECQAALAKINTLERALNEGQKIKTIENGEEVYDVA